MYMYLWSLIDFRRESICAFFLIMFLCNFSTFKVYSRLVSQYRSMVAFSISLLLFSEETKVVLQQREHESMNRLLSLRLTSNPLWSQYALMLLRKQSHSPFNLCPANREINPFWRIWGKYNYLDIFFCSI